MRIINLLYKGSKINYGVWVSAVSTAPLLKRNYGVTSEIWFPKTAKPLLNDAVKTVQLENTTTRAINHLIQEHQLDPRDTIIQTHGSWRYTSRWGYIFKKMGFKWVYHPHGMLNQHGFEEKGIKKKVYWHLMEKFLVNQADTVRLVSSPEAIDLKQRLANPPQMMVIPNGIDTVKEDISKKDKAQRYILFMSRLFHGKGVIPMVEGWLQSQLNNHSDFQLVIAGPDQGELEKVNQLLDTHPTSNISYIGPIYNQEKENWLKRSSFYILPSVSEAFSTSILEGMVNGLIPIITPNCNFPEVFQEGLGIKITTRSEGIAAGLNQILSMDDRQIELMQQKAITFANANYSLDKITELQYKMFETLLQGTHAESKRSSHWSPLHVLKGTIIGKLT